MTDKLALLFKKALVKISWVEVSLILMSIAITENKNIEKWEEGQQLTIMVYHNHVLQIYSWPYDLRHKKDH